MAFVFGCHMAGWSCADGPPHHDDVLILKAQLVLHEVIQDLPLKRDALWRGSLCGIDAIAWVLIDEDIGHKYLPHLLDHGLRGADVLAIAMEVDDCPV